MMSSDPSLNAEPPAGAALPRPRDSVTQELADANRRESRGCDRRTGSCESGRLGRPIAGATYSRSCAPKTIDWDRVCIALADERWVDPQDAASNEQLGARRAAERCHAAVARFLGLKNERAQSGSRRGLRLGAHSHGVPRPFDAVVLGMGDDGHTRVPVPRLAESAELPTR